MNRHQRRRLGTVFEATEMTSSEVAAAGCICAWDGCTAVFKGDMPHGWTWLLMYWSKRPAMSVLYVPHRDVPRDAVLCPEHTVVLDGQLKYLGRELNFPAQGHA
jgi:hypothetical protein